MTTAPAHELLSEPIVITDGGIETVLIFQRGIDLPAFAAFPLVEHEDGRAQLTSYLLDFVELADQHDASLILETPTWRANPDWGAELGYSRDDLRRVAHDSFDLADKLRTARSGSGRSLISGAIGPRGDGYIPGKTMSSNEAAEYHGQQIGDLADAGVDLVTSLTFSYVEEGVGVAAAQPSVAFPPSSASPSRPTAGWHRELRWARQSSG